MTALLTPLTVLFIVAGALSLRNAQRSPKAKWLSMSLMTIALVLAITNAIMIGREHGKAGRAATTGSR